MENPISPCMCFVNTTTPTLHVDEPNNTLIVTKRAVVAYSFVACIMLIFFKKKKKKMHLFHFQVKKIIRRKYWVVHGLKIIYLFYIKLKEIIHV